MTTKAEQRLDLEALEGMVDRHGLTAVLELLAEICREKGEHLRSNWQDKATAKLWERSAQRCEAASQQVVI